MIPAKVTKFSGRVEIACNFDWKWVKVVDDMLLQKAIGFARAPNPPFSCKGRNRSPDNDASSRW